MGVISAIGNVLQAIVGGITSVLVTVSLPLLICPSKIEHLSQIFRGIGDCEHQDTSRLCF